jgi:hypothetical protein
VLDRLDKGMRVIYSRKRWAPTQAFLLTGQALPGLILAGFAIANASLIDPFVWVIVALWAAAAVPSLVLSAWHILGEESVTIEDGSLRATRSIGRWSRQHSIPLSDIRDVAVIEAGPEARLNDMWGFGLPRVVVAGPRITVGLALAASPGEAEEVAGNLRASISARK